MREACVYNILFVYLDKFGVRAKERIYFWGEGQRGFQRISIILKFKIIDLSVV